MADAHICSSSGLDTGPNGAGQVTHFVSATRSFRNRELQNDATTSSTGEQTYYSTAPQSFRNRELQNDATTSSTGEHTYYSTAPQELWTELLSKDLQDQNFVSKTQNNEGESSCVEVHMLKQSDLLLVQLLAEGGQAHVYFAECKKFSTPVVVKRLKHGNVDLFRLQRRMEMVMKIRKKNNSAICRVFGVGTDFVGNAWVVMERMAGDLRTLIDRRMSYLEDGQMPFDYNNTITMMMHIAQGMEDLHRCDLIHGDLKASNILVTPVIMDPKGEDVDGSQQASESMYFYVKIGDFESSDGVVGTRFWRAPEVLQALRNGAKPILSPVADVYSYGMLCYEILTGRIPFEMCAWSNYDMVLSGQRPELPAYMNLKMKELLHACWHTEPRERPGWISIIKTLKEELILHPPGSQQPKRRAQPWIERERKETQSALTNLNRSLSSTDPWVAAAFKGLGANRSLSSTDPWVAAAFKGLGAETFETWQKKVFRETLPVLQVFSELTEAFEQDPYSIRFLNPQPTVWETNSTFNRVLCAFDEVWQLVKETWANHVMGGSRLGESGTDVIDGSEMETLEEGQIVAKRETERTVWEMWANEVLEPYNLLGPTAEDWLKKVLAASKEWQIFRATLDAWHTENQNSFRSWQDKLQKSSSAWKKVCVAIHAWHVEGPTAFIVWQILKKGKHAALLEHYIFHKGAAGFSEYYNHFETWAYFYGRTLYQDIISAEVNLKVHKATKLEATVGSIKAWKAVEVEKVTIRSLFLENTIDIATHGYP